jgi:hypothetical protein
VAFSHEKEGIKTSLVGVSILNMINTVVYKKKELVKCVIFVHKACLVGLGLSFLYQYKNINFGIHYACKKVKGMFAQAFSQLIFS